MCSFFITGRGLSVEEILFYAYVGLTWLAILLYIFSAYYGFKYLTGLGDGTELGAKNFGIVLISGILMLIATGINITFNQVRSGHWWDPILIVNAVDVLVNAASLHTMQWRWDRKWTAWLAIATVLIDANLRFIILFFF